VIAAAILCVGLLTAWGCLALWFQAPGGRLPRSAGTILRGLAVCLWGSFGVVVVVALTQGVAALGLAGFGLVFTALLLYRIRMPVAEIRSLLLSYVDAANELARNPRFYNTITANCTTIIYQLTRRIVGHLPLDFRLLLSGYLPAYVYEVGGLDTRYSLEELRTLGRITERAKESDRRDTFSADIRRGVPAVEPAGEARTMP
jgi:Domain of unknown function (DUF4105)